MKKSILSLFVLSTFVFSQNAWINEFHYDNSSTDENEFIEIVLDSTANDTLSNYEISLYRDSGTIYGNKTLDDYLLGSTDSTFKIFYLIYPVNGIQNGPADGMCLSYKGNVISGQFISYEGTLTATEGPANGMISTDIGVAEVGTDAGTSLQLTGTGTQYFNFTWQDPREDSPGFLNVDQYLEIATIESEPTNHVTNFVVDTVTNSSATLTWTGSVGDQLPHKYLLMAKLADASFPEIKDSTVIDNGNDWSGGVVAQNIAHADGDNEYVFSGLKELTEYQFVIYPYTNTGENTNYKTDPPAPDISTTTTETALLSISEIRQKIDDFNGKVVKISGIVTGKVSGKSEIEDGFFLQDNALPWSGIYVGDETYVDSVSIADSIVISGEIDEKFGLAKLINVVMVNVVTNNKPMPVPYLITTGTLADDQYVGLLVKVVDAKCTNEDLDHGEWQVDDGSGAMRVDDLMYAFTPVLNSIYDITGPGYYAYSNYKVVPRSEDDIRLITTAPIITHIGSSARVPETDMDFIDSVMVTSKFDLDAVILKYTVNRGSVLGIPMVTAGNDSTFTATIPFTAHNEGDAVEFWIFATNTNNDTTESAPRGFFAGMTNIGSLLQLDEQKELVYKGFYARTSGVATVANGVLNDEDLSINIQDQAFGAIRVFKYDVADYTIIPGHSYTALGKVDQYYGLNQLAPDDTLTDIIDNGPAIMPEPFAIDLATLLSGPESFENLLIKIESADTLGAGDNWPGGKNDVSMLITDDAGVSKLELRIEGSTDIGGNPEPVWPQNIVGVFSQYDYTAPYDGSYQIQPRAMSDFSDATGIQVQKSSLLPTKPALHNAYPNPFNPSTTIGYDIPANLSDPGSISLAIYNTLGQKIRTLLPAVSAGQHKIMWFGKSDYGVQVATGIYFVVFRVESKMFSKKILLVK